MAYDGMYGDLSTRGAANEVLNLAIQTKDEIVAAALAATTAADAAALSETNAAASSTSASASALAASDAITEINGIVSDAHRKYSIYVFERSVVIGQKVMQINPQYQLESQDPVVDWVGTASPVSSGVLTMDIVNNGVYLETAATINIVGGVVSFIVSPHTIQNGDTVVITCSSGTISDLSLTIRYESNEV